MNIFHQRIQPEVLKELKQAERLEQLDDPKAAFQHLERAHVLGQSSTRWHTLVHFRMFRWAWAQRDGKEMWGQVMRMIGALTKTALGWVPRGNTGGSNVSPFKSMPIPKDLQRILDRNDRG